MRITRLTLCSVLFFAFFSYSYRVSAQAISLWNGSENPQYSVKVTLLSLGSGSSRFTVERAFGSKNSAELTIGVIGWGWDWMNSTVSDGLLLKLAYKWNLIPQESANTPLAGFYVKPELVYADFDYQNKSAADIHHTRQVALLAECGYQLVFRWFVFDVYSGIGPSFGTDNYNNYFHSFMLFPVEGYLAFTAGFRIGVAL